MKKIVKLIILLVVMFALYGCNVTKGEEIIDNKLNPYDNNEEYELVVMQVYGPAFSSSLGLYPKSGITYKEGFDYNEVYKILNVNISEEDFKEAKDIEEIKESINSPEGYFIGVTLTYKNVNTEEKVYYKYYVDKYGRVYYQLDEVMHITNESFVNYEVLEDLTYYRLNGEKVK